MVCFHWSNDACSVEIYPGSNSKAHRLLGNRHPSKTVQRLGPDTVASGVEQNRTSSNRLGAKGYMLTTDVQITLY